jgi:hypothetical protein
MKGRDYLVYVGKDGLGITLWEHPTKAAEQSSGWLHYELKDGTIGLAQPKNWRYSKATA